MDRFSEQLVAKRSTGKDMFIRGVYVAAAILLLALIFFFVAGFGLVAVAVALAAGVIWLLVWMLQGTSVEYEYIVTNDDLDIDKIIGKRKRKRMVTISLRSVQEIAAYTGEKEINSDIVVMAHDETGIDMYYLTADTKKHGKLTIIFNPDNHTLYNIIGGFAPAVKKQYTKLMQSVKPADEDEDEYTETMAETETVNADTESAEEPETEKEKKQMTDTEE